MDVFFRDAFLLQALTAQGKEGFFLHWRQELEFSKLEAKSFIEDQLILVAQEQIFLHQEGLNLRQNAPCAVQHFKAVFIHVAPVIDMWMFLEPVQAAQKIWDGFAAAEEQDSIFYLWEAQEVGLILDEEYDTWMEIQCIELVGRRRKPLQFRMDAERIVEEADGILSRETDEL